MKATLVLLIIILCTAGSHQALAFPTKNSTFLEPRFTPGSSQSNPIKAELEIRGEDALTYDVDCWAMICKGKARDNLYLRKVNESTAKKNRQVKDGSAADKQPFEHRSKYGIKASPPTSSWANHRGWISAEESPFASTASGGKRSSTDTSWYEIMGFKIMSGKTAKVGPYCTAFNSKDKNACDAGIQVVGDWGFDVAKYAYTYNHRTKKFDYVGK
ncbi:uncharacterized protein BO88DRAFT_454859 [Aspergillus vadensis CBS 113365]|uniref:Uncharacterized protein n=1 Tax=Aspergillus vadensis (strain CBS 113365 / IMI 142717 / IBT 24658) TaxID=1448311 RepID=A0A319B5A2_ASPVC|nr:hypothetical protein BO88DRAFT_454859 [Aspergillus vadensis CBS 113365]PYH67966.1 hypothetical protein BO88DRAFT_454859 [Aspergillus vadensis CBS 113365]